MANRWILYAWTVVASPSSTAASPFLLESKKKKEGSVVTFSLPAPWVSRCAAEMSFHLETFAFRPRGIICSREWLHYVQTRSFPRATSRSPHSAPCRCKCPSTRNHHEALCRWHMQMPQLVGQSLRGRKVILFVGRGSRYLRIIRRASCINVAPFFGIINQT